jgi:hypothetical protein
MQAPVVREGAGRWKVLMHSRAWRDLALPMVFLVGAGLCIPSLGRAQEAPSESAAADSQTPPVTAASSANTFLMVSAATAAMCTVSLVAGTFAWWKDKGYTPLHLKDEGFFGPRTYAGGSDKAGHFYANWGSIRVMRSLYSYLGVRAPNDLWLATAFIIVLGTAVEMVDGFTPYGFAYGDVIANVSGALAAVLAEKFPVVDALVGFRISYVPTQHWVRYDKNYIRTVNDYTGMIFYADLKLSGVEEAFGTDPGPARYLSFGVTWNTYGYSPRDKDYSQRNLGVHVGLNVSELLLGSFDKGTPGVEGLARTSRYVAWPYTNLIFVRDLNNQDNTLNFGVANRSEIRL